MTKATTTTRTTDDTEDDEDEAPKKASKAAKKADAVNDPHMGKGKGKFDYNRLGRGMGNPY